MRVKDFFVCLSLIMAFLFGGLNAHARQFEFESADPEFGGYYDRTLLSVEKIPVAENGLPYIKVAEKYNLVDACQTAYEAQKKEYEVALQGLNGLDRSLVQALISGLAPSLYCHTFVQGLASIHVDSRLRGEDTWEAGSEDKRALLKQWVGDKYPFHHIVLVIEPKIISSPGLAAYAPSLADRLHIPRFAALGVSHYDVSVLSARFLQRYFRTVVDRVKSFQYGESEVSLVTARTRMSYEHYVYPDAEHSFRFSVLEPGKSSFFKYVGSKSFESEACETWEKTQVAEYDEALSRLPIEDAALARKLFITIVPNRDCRSSIRDMKDEHDGDTVKNFYSSGDHYQISLLESHENDGLDRRLEEVDGMTVRYAIIHNNEPNGTQLAVWVDSYIYRRIHYANAGRASGFTNQYKIHVISADALEEYLISVIERIHKLGLVH